MNNIITITKNTFYEAIRDRILIAIFAFALLFIASTIILSSLSLGEDMKIIKDFGLAGIYIFSIIITIFLGATLISKEFENNTLYLLLSKPVSKTQIILGKFFGLYSAIFLTTLLMSVAYLIVVAIKGGGFDFLALSAILLNLFEISIFISVSILFSTIFSPLLSTIFSILILYIGHSLPMILKFADKSDSWARYLLYPIYYLLPNLEKFNLRNVVVHSQFISASEYLLSILYAVIYSIVLLYIAKLAFENEEL